MRDTVVLAQLEARGATAELFLNGVPVTRLAPGGLPTESVAVEQLLVPGTNSLEIVVEPGPTPSTARSEKKVVPFRKVLVAGRLLRFAEGKGPDPEEGELLAEVNFRWQDDSIAEMALPTSSTVYAELGAAHGAWPFQSAPELEPGEGLFEEACGVLLELESAIRGGQVDALWKLSENQLRDVLRCYPGLTESFLRADLEQMLAHYQKTNDPVIPRKREDHDFRVVGNGRLLQLVDKDWSHSFKLRDPADGSAVAYPMFLGRVGKGLAIVR